MQNSLALRVQDDFLPDPEDFRRRVLKTEFGEVQGLSGETYTGISRTEFPEIWPGIERVVGFKVAPFAAVSRVNFAGELPNSAIHADMNYGEFAGIIYLSRPEHCSGGTAFWRHKKFGDTLPENWEPLSERIMKDGEKTDAWELAGFVEMKFNRFITYPTRRFHSRWPFSAFGSEKTNARLIHVMFYNPV